MTYKTMLYQISQDLEKGLVCIPHKLNECDNGGEFPIEIINPLTLCDRSTGRFAKIKGFISTKYRFHVKHNGVYFFVRLEDNAMLPIDKILETPNSFEDLSDYLYIYILPGWASTQG